MNVQEIHNREEWENFLKGQALTHFVQSTQSIDIYKKLGEQGFILGIYENNQLVGGSVVVTTHAKRGDFLCLPYGPILPTSGPQEALRSLVNYLRAFSQSKSYTFIRISPFLDDSEKNRKIFQTVGFCSAPMHVLAENTWLLNVTPSLDELMKNMNKNHRNLIRRCEREGVVIKTSTKVEDLAGLHSLLDITAKRHGFRRFSREYIDREFQSFLPHNTMLYESYLADGTLDSAAIIMFYGTMAAYRHSASVSTKLPSSYLLQWKVIQEIKRRELMWYNFWGIAPEGAGQEHPFYGITHFKKGFGGEKKDLLHCHDYPLNKKYWLNWVIESLRRMKRGF